MGGGKGGGHGAALMSQKCNGNTEGGIINGSSGSMLMAAAC